MSVVLILKLYFREFSFFIVVSISFIPNKNCVTETENSTPWMYQKKSNTNCCHFYTLYVIFYVIFLQQAVLEVDFSILTPHKFITISIFLCSVAFVFIFFFQFFFIFLLISFEQTLVAGEGGKFHRKMNGFLMFDIEYNSQKFVI